MSNFIKFILTKSIIIISTIILLMLSYSIIKYYNANYNFSMFIVAKFTELGPIYKSMPVYYKGYKIGKTRNIIPSKDYKYTLVDIILYPSDLKLPENIKAKVQKLDSGGNYIDLIYPDSPSEKQLKNGGEVVGETAKDLDSFIAAQADSGALTAISSDLNKALVSLDEAAQSMSYFFDQLGMLVEENRPNILKATSSTAQTTENVKELTVKINKEVSREKVASTVSNVNSSSANIEGATKNLEKMTDNLNKATKDLDKTMNKIDCITQDAKAVSSHIRFITGGLKELMKKKFAGWRLIFGRPVEDSCTQCGQ